MDFSLQASSEQLISKFHALESFDDLAEILEVSPNFLRYVLYQIPEDKKYTLFTIPKKRSKERRQITSPISQLKFLQYRLKQILECVYQPRASVHGFVTKRSIVTNAFAHKSGKSNKKSKLLKYVLNLDIKDFFPSIHFFRVRGLFANPPYNLPYNLSTWIARICCNKEGLPQGAPTSPIVSNMICNKMDSQLLNLAKKYRCIYTRYADDITFSTSLSHFPNAIAEKNDTTITLGKELLQLLELNNFKINAAKVRLQHSTQRQEITGLVVNKFPNVDRKYIRQIRAMLHDWAINGLSKAQEKHLRKYYNKSRYSGKSDLSFKDIVRGKIEFVGMVRGKNDPIYVRFMRKLTSLDTNTRWEDTSLMTEEPIRIFLSYASEDETKVREIYNSLKEIGYTPWMDKEDLIGGTQWEKEIDKAIDAADLFIAVISPHSSNKRGFLQKEIKRALEKWKEKLNSDIYLIPLRLEDCKVPDDFNTIQWLDYFKPNGWNRLTQSIQESIRRSKE